MPFAIFYHSPSLLYVGDFFFLEVSHRDYYLCKKVNSRPKINYDIKCKHEILVTNYYIISYI